MAIPSDQAEQMFKQRGSKAEIETGSDFSPKFDGDGLIPAITQHAKTGEILMFAFMNAQSLAKTLNTGTATYWSRSRGKLWVKGETSGETLKVIEVKTDCDQDVVLIRVEPQGRGAACHTGKRSCFYRSVEITDGETSLKDTGGEPLFDPRKVY